MSKRGATSKKSRSKGSSKKAKKEPSTPRFSLPHWSFDDLGVWTNRALLGVVLIAGVGGVAFGIEPLREHVASIRADPLVVEFNWPRMAGSAGDGTWMNQSEQDRLRAIALANLTTDPFDLESLHLTQDALASTGWFAEPPAIQRAPGGRVEIDGSWRRPAAVVRYRGWDYLVARDSALLPLRYRVGDAGALPVIDGAYTGPPQAMSGGVGYGLIWPGGDIGAAISLFDTLRESSRFNQVARIDVSRYVGEGLLTIVTDNGGRIVWGAAPGAGAPGEVSDAVKLERFENLFADSSWLGEHRPPVEIHTSVVLIDESARP